MQPIGEQDSVYVSIDEKLSLLSPSPSECCIFRVHDQLRRVNEKAYEPQIVAIGPYHHAKKGLQLMEEHKLRYLQSLLRRKNESSVERYRLGIKSLEPDARKCYAESISLTQDEMIDMMLLDGCFIIFLILKFNKRNLRDKDDPIFQRGWMISTLERDLMLFENQLPLFILWKLIDMIVEVPNQYDQFIDLGFSFFCDLFPSVGGREHIERNSLYECKHLLGLMYHRWVLSFVGTESKENKPMETTWRFIPSATELLEAGVKLEKFEDGTLLDIKFQNGVLHGVLQIPPLDIEDRTETFFRNLIAYEQYCPRNQLRYITDYTKLMDSLIDSPKDVAILSRRGIIHNWNGDGEVVSKMFNTIGDEIMLGYPFLYADIFKKVNIRCQKHWSRQMAALNRNYLNSPWTLISVLAALVLLLLTFTQTFFAVFPRK